MAAVMSSSYSLLCLSHDPATVLWAWEWRSRTEAVAAVGEHANWPEGLGREHGRCDMLLARWSGSLAEVGCLPTRPDNDRVPQHYPTHLSIRWLDTEWLRLLKALHEASAHGMNSDDVTTALNDLQGWHGCWTPERIRRLDHLL